MDYKKIAVLLLMAGAVALEMCRQNAEGRRREEDDAAEPSRQAWKPDPDRIFSFRHDTDGLVLTGCVPYPGGDTLAVPEEAHGRKVIELGWGAFTELPEVKTIILPGTIKKANTGSFTACRSLEKVRFEEGLEKISRLTFSSCPSLKEIELPASLTQIGDFVYPWNFNGVIRAPEGSEALRYAKEHGFRAEALETESGTKEGEG